ncbi:thiol-disulfide oxidoreductase DCC family protein [Falsibacillus albus]|uniref:DUF393 domain-containing protein n=1 Tax=Falsibacillus albus TaxID=2478915 RepID=A0A3L7K3B0_9BACI|nr:DUF393 domain-containing protein [Falsibacillus albus]RLQ96759.1 DUF393 domain-containing protein [Falsibacillus albus]
MKRHKVFFDAQCPLCSNAKKILMKLDWGNRIEWIPVQSIENTSYAYLKDQGRDLYDEIHMVTADGHVLAGFQTVRRILKALPLTFPISLLLYLPFMNTLFSPLYMWVSKNRYDWFGRYDRPLEEY